MDDLKLKKQVTFVAILRIVLNSLGLLGAGCVFAVMKFVKGLVLGDEIAETIISFIGNAIPFFIGSVSLLGIIGGIGLFSYKNWARILVMVVSVICCLNIPIGTLAGVYSIWVLMQNETIKLFNQDKSEPFSPQT